MTLLLELIRSLPMARANFGPKLRSFPKAEFTHALLGAPGLSRFLGRLENFVHPAPDYGESEFDCSGEQLRN